jgi:hypothetical protein
MSLGEWFPTFLRIMMPSFSRSKQFALPLQRQIPEDLIHQPHSYGNFKTHVVNMIPGRWSIID